MDTLRFKEIVTAFLDSNDRLDMDRGDLVLQIGADLVTGRLATHQGALFVSEDGMETRAEEWIINRLAMLPLLADRILSSVPEIPAFVTPRGMFLDEVSRSPQDIPSDVPDAVAAVWEFLNRRPGGTCSVLYLTSDAGEGKTTVINHLARAQASRYKRKEVDWLLVPISLGGKPFLRFDDVVVASLVNQLRFQRLYFDAFIQMVRMGVLVPALDGFEEIFVETSEGDAISSLGTLIRQLRGEGAILIAARRAYFEFRRLQTQARLLDGLPDVDVAFGRVGLHRWSRDEFVTYAKLNGVNSPHEMYESVARVLAPDHPLLTRPILVRRLIEIAKSGGFSIDELRPRANNYFAWLVERLIEREANDKWIDKHGEPPRSLLTVSEHYELMSYIAEEMWISKTAVLSDGMMDSLAEIFCDTKGCSPVVSRQVKERLKQHALIISTGPTRKEFAFDHDDFREFFLGEQLAAHLESQSEPDLRKLFRIDLLPALALDSAIRRIGGGCEDSGPVIDLVLRVGLSESSSSFVRENAGALLAPLLGCPHAAHLLVEGMVFPPEALKGHTVSNVEFAHCYFRPTSLAGTALNSCRFHDCEFEHLSIVSDSQEIKDTTLSGTRIHSLTVEHDGEASDYYNPDEITVVLGRAGFGFEAEQLTIEHELPVEVEPDLRVTEKALQTFHRSTVVPEGTFRLRLSIHANHFVDSLLPRLLRAGIVVEVKAPGTRKFKLGVPLTSIANALEHCRGSLDEFLRIASSRS